MSLQDVLLTVIACSSIGSIVILVALWRRFEPVAINVNRIANLTFRLLEAVEPKNPRTSSRHSPVSGPVCVIDLTFQSTETEREDSDQSPSKEAD